MSTKKVSELTGAELDAAVARAVGYEKMPHGGWGRGGIGLYTESSYAPSRYWDVGGPIIERERMLLDGDIPHERGWVAIHPSGGPAGKQYGPTPLIAAMRAFVASKFGEEVSDA